MMYKHKHTYTHNAYAYVNLNSDRCKFILVQQTFYVKEIIVLYAFSRYRMFS